MEVNKVFLRLFLIKILLCSIWASPFSQSTTQGLDLIRQSNSLLEKAQTLKDERDFDRALQLTDKALDLLKAIEKDSLVELQRMECLHSYANIYRRSAQLQKAYESYRLLWEESEKVFGSRHKMTLLGKRFTALSLVDLGRLDEAILIQIEVLENYSDQKNSLDKAGITYDLSQTYQRKSDYDKSLTYAAKALAMYQDYYPGSHRKIAYSYNQIGNALEAERKYEEARGWYLKAVDMLVELNGEKSYRAALSLMNVGKSYAFLENYNPAIKYYKEVWEWFDNSIEKDHVRYVELWLSLGYAYYAKGDMNKAKETFLLAYERACLSAPEKSFDRVQALFYLSLAIEDPQELIKVCQKSLWGASNGKEDLSDFALPTLDQVRIEQNFLNILIRKAGALRSIYEKNKNLDYLVNALKTYDLASDFIDKKNEEFLNGGVQITFSSQYRVVYEKRVDLLKQLYSITGDEKYIDYSFNSMEKSRGLFLLKSLADANYDKILPERFSLQKKELKKNIVSYEIEIDQEVNDSLRGILHAHLFDLKQQNDKLNKEIQESFPQISNAKEELTITSMSDLQTSLQPGEVFIECLETDEKLFVLELRNSSKRLHTISGKKEVFAKVDSLINLVKDRALVEDYSQSEANFNRYKRLSFDVYSRLFSKIDFSNCQNLTIAPDGILHFLPFDLLLSSPDNTRDDYSKLPFLIHKFPINYVFSGTLKTIETKPSSEGKILAFAPSYKKKGNVLLASRAGFTALAHTSLEVKAIEKLWPSSSTLYNQDASELAFKSKAKHYSILHLAMHAFTDDEHPELSGMIFTENADNEDDVLYCYELQNMNLNAHLAVLSACNTGSGVLKKGEGVMSLARSFREAGVPNVLMSLWQADDEATRMIMESFYENLKKGQGKSKALQNAKLTFLEANYKSHPHFWASFVLMGDLDAVSVPNKTLSPYLFISGLVFLLLGIYFLLFRSKPT